MHEVSLCRNLLQLIEQQAAQQRFSRVKTVYLEVGALAGVEPAALSFAFDAVMHESLAAGARLQIIPIAARAYCHDCGREVVVQQRYDACPECSAFALTLSAGTELCLKELEVE